MASVEEVTPVSNPEVQVGQTKNSEKGQADGEKKRRDPPKKPDPVDPPNEAAFNIKVSQLEGQLEALKKDMEKKKALVGDRLSTVGDSKDEMGDLIKQAQDIRKELSGIYDEFKAVSERVKQQDEATKGMARNAAAVKKNLRFLSEEEIDEHIRELEYKLSVSTVSMREEKEVLGEITRLRTSKNLVKEYFDLDQRVKADKEKLNGLYAEKKELGEKIGQLKDSQKDVQAKIDDIKKQRTSRLGDLPQLNEQKKTLYEQMKSINEEIRQLRREFKKAQNDYEWYLKREETYKKWQEREKRIKAAQERERLRKEREALRAQKEAARAAEEALRHPYEEELSVCNTLIAYLSSIMPRAETKQETVKTLSLPEGVKAVGKKTETEEKVLFAGKGPKSKKGKRKTTEKKETRVLTHPIDAISGLQLLRLGSPKFPSEVAACLQLVKEKLAYFETAPPKNKKKKEDSNQIETSTERKDRENVIVTITAIDSESAKLEITVA